jgi:sulfur-oxidizing protein SoxX
VVAVEGGRIEASVRLDRPAVPAEFGNWLRHIPLLPYFSPVRWHVLQKSSGPGGGRGIIRPIPGRSSARLTPVPVASYVHIARQWPLCFPPPIFAKATIDERPGKRPLIAPFSRTSAPLLALLASLAGTAPALAQSAIAEGQKLAFDRGKGNCLTCHVIKGGEYPGTLGPELSDIKSKYKRDELIAIVFDETKRNPQTVMPPFGRNRLLTEKEINAIVDFLQTL